MKNVLLHSTLVCLFLQISCKPPKSTVQQELNNILPGYAFHEAPNELDKPGLIFRVTPNGQRFPVGYLNVIPDKGKIEIKSISETKSLSVGVLANLLELPQNKIKLGTDVDLNKVLKFNMKATNTSIESLTDFAIDSLLKKALKLIKENGIVGRMNNDYYIIRESILATKLEYNFDREVSNKLGLDVALSELTKIKPNTKLTNGAQINLGFTYENPLRVFFKAEQLTIFSDNGTLGIQRSYLVDSIMMAEDPNIRMRNKAKRDSTQF